MGENVLFASLDEREWVSPGDFGGNSRATGWMCNALSLLSFAVVCRSRWNGSAIVIVNENDSLLIPGLTEEDEPYYWVREHFANVAEQVRPAVAEAWARYNDPEP